MVGVWVRLEPPMGVTVTVGAGVRLELLIAVTVGDRRSVQSFRYK